MKRRHETTKQGSCTPTMTMVSKYKEVGGRVVVVVVVGEQVGRRGANKRNTGMKTMKMMASFARKEI